jgi:murein L,D-transpeptidase YafK
VLDYPNEEDRRAGRTGQGIWIHGTAPDSAPFQTRGCLEMDNRDLVELSQMLKKGVGVPVLIVSDSTLTDIPAKPDFALCKTRRDQVLAISSEVVEQFGKILTSWKTAWETKDIGQYETFYDTIRFSGQGLTWGGWKERKLRTFSLYDTIAIAIDKMKIVKETDTKLIVKFLQRYSTNINTIENGKKLWFEKVNDFWKITGESTCTIEELLL